MRQLQYCENDSIDKTLREIKRRFSVSISYPNIVTLIQIVLRRGKNFHGHLTRELTVSINVIVTNAMNFPQLLGNVLEITKE